MSKPSISRHLGVRGTLAAALLTGGLTASAQQQPGTPAAQELPLTTTSLQIGAGPTGVLDTYLSQESFSGTGVSLLATSERERPGRQWTTLAEHQVHLADVSDRAGLRDELQAGYTFYAGRLRRWQPGHGWRVQAGLLAAADVGVIYNTANGNNPAQARLSLQAMPTAVATKDLELLHRPLRVRYELNLPLLGVMFSPRYGQSYYELFSLGHYDRNVVPTTFVAAPTMRQQLTVGYAVGTRLMLTIGYLGDYQQSQVNNLKSHVYSHRLMVGVVRRFSVISHRL